MLPTAPYRPHCGCRDPRIRPTADDGDGGGYPGSATHGRDGGSVAGPRGGAWRDARSSRNEIAVLTNISPPSVRELRAIQGRRTRALVGATCGR